MPTPTKQVAAVLKHGFLNKLGAATKPHCPASPPPSCRPSPPTLSDMMSEDRSRESHRKEDAEAVLRRLSDRIAKVLASAPNWRGRGDVRLCVVSKEGFRVAMEMDAAALVDNSRFFKERIGKRVGVGEAIEVEISECDDVEVYLEVMLMMHCKDMDEIRIRIRMAGMDVSKVLGLLKVSAAMMFDGGILCCLEYLEAVPWSEEEEEKVLTQLSQLQFSDSVGNVLKRVVSNTVSSSAQVDDIISRLIAGVLQSKDEKSRREMKNLLSKLLKEDAFGSHNRLDVSREALYHLCHGCLSSLILCLSEATSMDEIKQDRASLMAKIAREADNLHWIVDILVDRKMGDEFVNIWADQKDLATLYSKIPIMYRHEISRITAQLCIAIGRGRVLVPKQVCFSLLSTWLEGLYEDFGWMTRTSRSIDRNLVEHGLGQTILTLPLQQQQVILLAWFDRFLNKGADCPNIRRAFEVWWRRSFNRHSLPDHEKSSLQIAVYDQRS